jgi:hypothetical protein
MLCREANIKLDSDGLKSKLVFSLFCYLLTVFFGYTARFCDDKSHV